MSWHASRRFVGIGYAQASADRICRCDVSCDGARRPARAHCEGRRGSQHICVTLGEASERAGFRVHAYVLMSNHYHLLLETKEANLSQGMGWLQNAFTRRINTGHSFGGMSLEDAIGRFSLSRETVFGRCSITFTLIRCAPVCSKRAMAWTRTAGAA